MDLSFLTGAAIGLTVFAVYQLIRQARSEKKLQPVKKRFIRNEVESEIGLLIDQGNVIGAIKRLRELDPTLDLQTAKRKVEAFQQGKPLNTRFDVPRTVAIDDTLVRELLAQGHKLEAIKRVRELYPEMGLKEAKEYVESISRS